MLKNEKGYIIVSKYQSPGNVSCQMFQSETVKDEWEQNHTTDNEPETFNVYMGKELDDEIANATAPDTTTTLGIIIQGIVDAAVLNKIKDNPRVLPRAKWENITYEVV